MSYLLLFHCNVGYVNAPKSYIVRTLPVLLEYDRVALSAFVGGSTSVFSSIGYSKCAYTIDKVIHKWGHVTQKAFLVGVMNPVIPVKGTVEGRCVLLPVTAIQLHNYASYRKTRSS